MGVFTKVEGVKGCLVEQGKNYTADIFVISGRYADTIF